MKIQAITKVKPQSGFTLTTEIVSEKLNKNEVLVAMIFSGICGTDLHIYQYDDWAKQNLLLPHINGHEGLGKVIAVGSDVTRVKPEQFVMFESHEFDGTCWICQQENFHVCIHGKILGVTKPGIWREQVQIHEQHLVPVPDQTKIPLAVWGLSEPMGNAFHTLSYSQFQGKNVLVSGDGPIGLISALIIRTFQPKNLIITGLNPLRNRLATKWGLTYFNPQTADYQTKIKQLTNEMGIDIVCEMSGSVQALNQSLSVLNPGGEINVLSLYPQKQISLPLNEFTLKNFRCQFVTGRKLWTTWETTKKFLLTHPEIIPQLEELITDYVWFQDFSKIFSKIMTGKVGKAYLVFDRKWLPKTNNLK